MGRAHAPRGRRRGRRRASRPGWRVARCRVEYPEDRAPAVDDRDAALERGDGERAVPEPDRRGRGVGPDERGGRSVEGRGRPPVNAHEALPRHEEKVRPGVIEPPDRRAAEHRGRDSDDRPRFADPQDSQRGKVDVDPLGRAGGEEDVPTRVGPRLHRPARSTAGRARARRRSPSRGRARTRVAQVARPRGQVAHKGMVLEVATRAGFEPADLVHGRGPDAPVGPDVQAAHEVTRIHLLRVPAVPVERHDRVAPEVHLA